MPAHSEIVQYDHFIPVSTSRLIEQLATLNLDQQQLQVMRQIEQILSFQFYQKFQRLKQDYQPLNPDNEYLPSQQQSLDNSSCIEPIRELLINANFSELDQQQIEYALEKTSPYGLKISINFDAFSHVALFYRGKSSKQVQLRDWKKLYLKKKTVNLISYRRLFLLLSYKDQKQKTGLHLKLFKEILRPDLEMLFPDSKVQIKVFDKLKLIITGGGGTAGGILATISKITAAVNPWTIVIALAGFIMLIWRQVSKIFIQKTRYMMTLAQNLYFHNMDNNLGAISYLIDMARQEEIKEAIMAYALLCHHQVKDVEQLDSLCEEWFNEQFDIPIDFDVSDAVTKLKRFELLDDSTDTLRTIPANTATQQLQTRWLDFIQQKSDDFK